MRLDWKFVRHGRVIDALDITIERADQIREALNTQLKKPSCTLQMAIEAINECDPSVEEWAAIMYALGYSVGKDFVIDRIITTDQVLPEGPYKGA